MGEREQIWRERIEWQRRSGRTVAECCSEAGVSVASFYRWKKLLSEQKTAQGRRSVRSLAEGPPRRRAEAATERSGVPAKRATRFVPVAVKGLAAGIDSPQSIGSGSGISLRVELPNGVVIHVASDLDSQRLGDVVIAAGQIRSVPDAMTTLDLHRCEVSSC
jgi:transposase-like protein